MSIAKQIQRLNSAKASIKNAIENKGMHVSNSDTLDKYAQYIDNIVGDDIDKSVIFIDDYTQSIYAKYTKEQFLSLTSMPENPTHPNMISQGWNWGLEDAKYYVEKYGRLTIGQIYTTLDGATKITIDTNVWPDLSPFIIYLYCTKRGDCATIDFGDGSEPVRTGNLTNFARGGSLSAGGEAAAKHQYTENGIYEISIQVDDDCIANLCYGISGDSTNWSLFGYSYQNKRLVLVNAVTKIHIGDRIKEYGLIGGINTEVFTISNSVITAGRGGIDGMKIKYFSFPSSITQNDDSGWMDGQFQFATELKHISFPPNFPSLDTSMFEGCSSLEQICLPESITEIKQRTFNHCVNLKHIIIPDSIVGIIDNYVFENCVSLEELILPNGITDIRGYGARYLTNCKKLILPSNLQSLAINTATAFESMMNLEELIIPDSVIGGTGRFASVQKLKKLYIGNGITTIWVSAFRDCFSLENLTIGNSVETIDNYAFRYPYVLKNINFPETLKTIGSYAFENCVSLEEIEIPDSVTSIGVYAFVYCTSVKRIKLSANCPIIPDFCFTYCYFLSELEIPEGVTTIGRSAFEQYGSNCLEKLVLPSTITSIGTKAFACGTDKTINKELIGIWIYATTPPTIANNSFENLVNCPIYIPKGTLEAYSSATNWSIFTNRFVEMEDED